MKPLYLFLLFFPLFYSCQNEGSSIIKEVETNYKNKGWFSCKISEILYFEDKNVVNSYYCISKKNPNGNVFVFCDNKIFFYMIDNSGIKYIDNVNEEVSFFKKGLESQINICENLKLQIRKFDIYTPYYSQNRKIINIKDTVINFINYKILESSTEKTLISQDNKLNQPEQYRSYSYFNTSNKLIDKIEYILIDTIKNNISERKIVYKFSDFSFENKDKEIDSLFDFNNSRYSFYSKHDDNKQPYSCLYASEKDTIISKELLNYPIVNLKGDTTILKNEKGWVLLDFWFFGCVTCKDFLNELSQEKSKYGKTILEKENVKIMSINPLSSNVEKLKKEAKPFHLENIVYYSKGINQFLDMKKMPVYYLLSPQKKIVYISHKLGDYSEILKIIHSYK